MKGGRGKTSSRFHERLGSSAAEQVGSLKSWIERRVLQMLKGAGLVMGSVAFCNLLVWWTIVGYFLLYWLLIPRPMVFEPQLNFDFDAFQDGPALIHGPKTPFEFPIAEVFFPSHDQQWLWEVIENRGLDEDAQNNNTANTPPYFSFPGALGDQLVFGELYDVSVHLVLPEHKANHELGNFMVETELLMFDKTLRKHVLARSRRPTAVPYRPWYATTIFDLLVLPFRFFLGWYMPEHQITVNVLEGWIEESDHRRMPNGVKVTLSDPRLGVSRSWIRFAVRLTGIRYYMYYWFWTSFALLTSLAISAQSGLTFSAILAKLLGPTVVKRVRFVREFPEMIRHMRGSQDEEETEEEEEAEEGEDEEVEEVQEGEEGPVDVEETFEEEEEPGEPTTTGGQASDAAASAQVLFPSMAGPRQGTLVEVDTDPDKVVVDMPLGVEPVREPVVEQSATVRPSAHHEGVSPPKIEAGEERKQRLSSDFDVVLVDTPSGDSPTQPGAAPPPQDVSI